MLTDLLVRNRTNAALINEFMEGRTRAEGSIPVLEIRRESFREESRRESAGEEDLVIEVAEISLSSEL